MPVDPITPPQQEEQQPAMVEPETKTGGNLLKGLAGAAAIGAGIGAIAYGVNEHIKDKEYKDGYEYSYAESTPGEFKEEETEEEQYTPYEEEQKKEEPKDKVDDFFGE